METEGQQEITKDISQNNMPGTSAQSSQQQPNKPQDVSPIPPREEDYGIPTSETEYESMVERMATCGFSRTDLDKILETKRTSFNKATREFRVREKKRQSDETKSTRKTRKNSFSKQT